MGHLCTVGRADVRGRIGLAGGQRSDRTRDSSGPDVPTSAGGRQPVDALDDPRWRVRRPPDLEGAAHRDALPQGVQGPPPVTEPLEIDGGGTGEGVVVPEHVCPLEWAADGWKLGIDVDRGSDEGLRSVASA